MEANRWPVKPAADDALTHDRVLEAALAIVDRDGLDSLTMRHLGRALGVQAMSLYHHVEGKQAVLRGIVELLYRKLEVPACADWRAYCRQALHGFRRLLLQHPHTLPLVVSYDVTDPAARRPIDATLHVLRTAGFGKDEAVHVLRTLVGFTIGYVSAELGALAGSEDADAEYSYGLDLIIAGVEARLRTGDSDVASARRTTHRRRRG